MILFRERERCEKKGTLEFGLGPYVLRKPIKTETEQGLKIFSSFAFAFWDYFFIYNKKLF